MLKFKKAKSKILVTSALPYANGPIHCGHLLEYIQTDIFVRFLRLTGEDVLYVCADDAHGAPIEIKAKDLGITPEQLVADVYKDHTEDFANFGISFDNYYTTNSPENKHYSDLVFNTLKEKGLIYTKEIEVTYCEHDKRTLPDRYVKGKCPKCGAQDQYGDVCEHCNATYKTIDLVDPYCVICKNRPTRKKSEHYFFRLSKFSDELSKWFDSNKNLQPEIINFASNWIKNGLEDWNISRDGPYFGFKIPGEKDKYYYVWLDAPIGYIASTENYCKKHNLKTDDYWKNPDSKIYHFIGKDIIYFHFLFWPAMLLGSGFSLPHDIVVHGFLTVDGEKMSKSRGTFFTAKEFLQKYDSEHLRYYYASMLGKKLTDIDLDFKLFRDKINNELVANIGNFCHRVISFSNKNFDGKITKPTNPKVKTVTVIGQMNKPNTLAPLGDWKKFINDNFKSLNFNEVVRSILLLSAMGNQKFQNGEPWKTIKTDKKKVEEVCYDCLDRIKNLSILLAPILPELSSEIQKQLNLKNLKWTDLDVQFSVYNLNKEKILVQKIEEVSKPVFPLNLKVAKILSVKEHPDADKLYVLEIDAGSEKRQLVAGLRLHYSKDELIGKNIIIVSNLKHAKLRGVVSQGMLLAGDDGTHVGVLTVDNSNPGDSVFIDGHDNSNKEITYDEFSKIEIKINHGKAVANGKELKTEKEYVRVEKAKDGAKIK